METWKLSIKPDSEKSVNPLKVCKDRSVIGVGWHHAYVEKHPSDFEEAKDMVLNKWNRWPHQLRKFCEELRENDLVWIHQNGYYYLCKVKSNKIILGRDIVDNYDECDLGHAREADWVEVSEEFVSGAVQRGTIAPGIIQRIKLNKKEKEIYLKLFNELKKNKDWKPKIDETYLSNTLSNLNEKSEIFSLMSTDDVEDIVAAYLQTSGWIIIKSTCFRSKPKYEFSMLNKKRETANVQVKSGKNPVPLKPINYQEDAKSGRIIYLFSTNKNPYPGPSAKNVATINHNDLIDWVLNNLWCLTFSLKNRLWISTTGGGNIP